MCNKSFKLEVKKVSVVLYERFENALLCIIFTRLLTRFTQISNFSIFRQTRVSLALLKIVFENSLRKGIFWWKKKKSNFCNCLRILDNYRQRLLKTHEFCFLVKLPEMWWMMAAGLVASSRINFNYFCLFAEALDSEFQCRWHFCFGIDPCWYLNAFLNGLILLVYFTIRFILLKVALNFLFFNEIKVHSLR